MALTQPTLYSQAAFDATQSHIFEFNVIGGDQVVANTLTIKNNSNNTTVYSATQNSYALYHTLPANALTNGGFYSATLTTKNARNETSVASNTIQFYCRTAPTFILSNVSDNFVLTASSYNFELYYSQNENEPLQQYSFNLYDNGQNLIGTSGIIYTNSSTVPFTSQYTFMGLLNGQSYYIELTGLTLYNTELITQKKLFSVNYNASSSKLNLTNNCLGGYVNIASAPVAIFGTAFPSPPTYINDEFIDLSAEGSYVMWDNGFSTSTIDWTLSIWGYNFSGNNEICILKNDQNETVTISTLTENNKLYLILTVENVAGNIYQIISDSIAIPSSSDNLFIWVRRIDNLYDLVLQNLGG